MIKYFFLFVLFCSYQHITTCVPQSIHLLEVDPAIFKIMPARALDKCVGRETVLSLSSRKNATGGVNGGFFSFNGFPSGILKIDGKWYGLPVKPRGAIGWTEGGKNVVFDQLLTHLEGVDFRIDPQIDCATGDEWEAMDHIVGGAPLLVHKGKRVVDFSSEETRATFLTNRHARTAVGLLSNGNWVFVVVDGKQPHLSLGMTMDELACFMEDLGCVEALNLDGGGSSTFVYQGEVINHPLGDGYDHDNNLQVLRSVSDAILIMER
ncbi:MAG: hypothetical protein S4CHLAM45_14970 [Chlamydiales bacterium]|nr:hypothetical protein [Chlamydiales bacterium]MCH9620114.1 hypothetical protein [Chlamydiales bacterium]MCH9623584.1 hypothetical protein [Chlamydiales bacterium]